MYVMVMSVESDICFNTSLWQAKSQLSAVLSGAQNTMRANKGRRRNKNYNRQYMRTNLKRNQRKIEIMISEQDRLCACSNSFSAACFYNIQCILAVLPCVFLPQVLSQGSAPLSFLISHIEHYVKCQLNTNESGCEYILLSAPSPSSQQSSYVRTLEGITVHLPHFPYRSRAYLQAVTHT